MSDVHGGYAAEFLKLRQRIKELKAAVREGIAWGEVVFAQTNDMRVFHSLQAMQHTLAGGKGLYERERVRQSEEAQEAEHEREAQQQRIAELEADRDREIKRLTQERDYFRDSYADRLHRAHEIGDELLSMAETLIGLCPGVPPIPGEECKDEDLIEARIVRVGRRARRDAVMEELKRESKQPWQANCLNGERSGERTTSPEHGTEHNHA